MKVVILAGGQGKRLKSVVSDRPKPMAAIAGRPFLEHLISNLKKHGLEDIVISIGYQGKVISDYFKDGSRFGVKVSYLKEDQPLGTGGALKLFLDASNPTEDFMVINGDTFVDLDYNQLVSFHRQAKTPVTLSLVSADSPNRSGVVDLDPSLRVVGFSEKKETTGSRLINAGVYVFSPNLRRYFPQTAGFSLENDVLPKILPEASGFVCSGYFIDIGIPEDYARANQELPRFLKS